jgi:3-phenylpropionate/trans-cinnamate dioxygenase ferredoxin reductase subunit
VRRLKLSSACPRSDGGYDEVVVRGRTQDEKFSVFYFRGGDLLAVHAINRPQDFMFARKAL